MNLRPAHSCQNCRKLIGWAGDNTTQSVPISNEIRSAFNQNSQPLPHQNQQNQTFPSAPIMSEQDFQNIKMVVDDDDKPPSYLEATSKY